MLKIFTLTLVTLVIILYKFNKGFFIIDLSVYSRYSPISSCVYIRMPNNLLGWERRLKNTRSMRRTTTKRVSNGRRDSGMCIRTVWENIIYKNLFSSNDCVCLSHKQTTFIKKKVSWFLCICIQNFVGEGEDQNKFNQKICIFYIQKKHIAKKTKPMQKHRNTSIVYIRL